MCTETDGTSASGGPLSRVCYEGLGVFDLCPDLSALSRVPMVGDPVILGDGDLCCCLCGQKVDGLAESDDVLVRCFRLLQERRNAYSSWTLAASSFQAAPGATVCVGRGATMLLSGAAVTSGVSCSCCCCCCCWGAARANSGAAARVMNVEKRILSCVCPAGESSLGCEGVCAGKSSKR